MTDPYKVLGVSPSATDEEVKVAYKNLVKKYHPDNYAQSPLADVAEEKMKEINEAYDTVTQMRKSGTSYGSSSSSSQYGSYSANSGGNSYNPYGSYQNYNYNRKSSGKFTEIRNLMNQGRYSEADALLENVPETSRDAEWNYLKGVIYYQRGWLDQAVVFLRRAIEMDPSNMEYQIVYNRLMAQKNTAARGFNGTSLNDYDCSPCGTCSSLLCANCFLNMCCGGGGCGC